MLRVLKNIFSKVTLGLLVCLTAMALLLVAFVIMLFEETADLAIAFAFMAFLFFLSILFFDRLAVRHLPLKAISIIEFFIFLIGFSWILWSYRTTELLITPKQHFFVVVYLDEGINRDDFRYEFPFSKKLEIDATSCILVDQDLLDSEVIIKPVGWDGYSGFTKDVYINGSFYKAHVYRTGNIKTNEDDYFNCIEAISL